jgi:hypothetical protein
MIWYTVEQCVSLHESYWCSLLQIVRICFVITSSGSQFQTQYTFIKFVNEVISSGSCLDKKPAKINTVLSVVKVGGTGYELQHTHHVNYWDDFYSRPASQNCQQPKQWNFLNFTLTRWQVCVLQSDDLARSINFTKWFLQSVQYSEVDSHLTPFLHWSLVFLYTSVSSQYN